MPWQITMSIIISIITFIITVTLIVFIDKGYNYKKEKDLSRIYDFDKLNSDEWR